jgi:plastocyanin
VEKPLPGRTIRLAFTALVLVAGSGLAAHAEDSTVSLTIKDHRFDPAEFEVPSGKKVKLVIRNLDGTPEEFESDQLRREKIVPAGGEISLFVGPLKPGRYEFFGDFNPQTARGHIVAR